MLSGTTKPKFLLFSNVPTTVVNALSITLTTLPSLLFPLLLASSLTVTVSPSKALPTSEAGMNTSSSSSAVLRKAKPFAVDINVPVTRSASGFV